MTRPPRRGGRSRRDRHGRGLRGRLVPTELPLARSRAEQFDDLVLDAVEDLERRWERELAGVEFAVEDVPWVDHTDPDAVVLDADVLDDGSVPLARVLPAHRDGGREVPPRIVVKAPDLLPLPRFRPPSPPTALEVPRAATPLEASQDTKRQVTATAAGQVLNVRGVTALGFFGSAQFRHLELDVRYAEGQNRALVEGAVGLRFLATPWLSMQVGPHARRFDTPLGAERWVTWRLGGRADVAIAGPSVRGHALLWRALGLQVNVPPGSGSASGGEVGVTIDLASRPVWLGLAYGIDRAQVRDAAWRETVETLTFTAGLRRR